MPPGFDGSIYQAGTGLLDVLRSMFCPIFPNGAWGPTSFLRGAADLLYQGKTVVDAANGGIAAATQVLSRQTISFVVQ